MDTVNRHAKQQIGQAVARAYGLRRPDDTQHDPQLCARCQQVKPSDRSDRCEDCQQ